MTSKFKVNNAKEKITMLREKYFKNVQGKQELNSSSESITPLNIESSPTNDIIDFDDRLSYKQTDEAEGKLKLHDVFVQHNKRNSDVTTHSLEEKTSSKSSVHSNLSIQFERIRFISSSSDDLSHVQIVSTANHSKLNESIPTSSIYSLEDPEKSKRSSSSIDCEESLKNNSEKSLSVVVSEISSKMSSIKEVASTSENGQGSQEILHSNEIHSTSNSGVMPFESEVLSINTQKGIKDEEKINIGSNQINSERNDVLKGIFSENSYSESNKVMNYSDLPQRNKSNKKFNLDEFDEFKESKSEDSLLRSRTVPKAVINYLDKSTNTDPILDKVSNWRKYRKKLFGKNFTNYEQTAPAFKDFFTRKQHTKKHNLRSNHLVKHLENIKEQSVTTPKEEYLLPKYNFPEDMNLYCCKTNPEFTNNEVVCQLLKNQIQLTRHFMESHHQMYLQVCKAVQLLNDNYSSVG